MYLREYRYELGEYLDFIRYQIRSKEWRRELYMEPSL